ncbi:DUF3515 domain-containing protein [Actinotalea subterranea]|uniref:DUF3515 domain-containing protein n=1 Tax=Actinotalea subterranea TaxID=2607497 RepID=UPI0011EEC01F|nr:DUF3515 domain-containing protein [Actinotalea subterranea]
MRPATSLVGSLLAAAALAGCSQPVVVPVAPHAAEPLCADVVLALPVDLGDLERLETGSQATVAWGDRADPVTLRCGVEPPAPTTDHCVTAEDERASVDWVAVPGEADEDGSAPWTFTTYGRSPAVEVQVPASVTSTRSTSFLLDLGPAIAQVEQTRTCL